MEPRSDEQRLIQGKQAARKPQFKIERLEERIAPRKGGVPGPPDHSNGDGGGGRHRPCQGCGR